MPDSNTYKFSVRDGTKYLTCNGVEVEEGLEPDWGWYGYNVTRTAYEILKIEYGVKTANQYFSRFAREYLAEIVSDEFVLTSGAINFIIDGMETIKT
jgi:hypothetical protein